MDLCTTFHAERRAIAFAAKEGIPTEKAILYMSGWVPCFDCAQDITESGIIILKTPNLVFIEGSPYRFEDSEEIMKNAGMELIEEQYETDISKENSIKLINKLRDLYGVR
jgi:deoxycytidylate deaminase